MKTIIAIIGVATLCLGLVGCSEESTPTAVQETPGNVVVKAPGDINGAQIVRYDGWIAVTYLDLKRNLRIVLGVDMDLQCVGVFAPDIVGVMEVTNPVDQDVVMQLINGDGVHAWIYPLYEWDCERFLGEGPIASGFVHVVSTDNDLWAYLDTNTNPRVNSYKTTATGELFTPDGDKVLLAFTNKVVWPGYPEFDDIRELVSSINLAFTGGP